MPCVGAVSSHSQVLYSGWGIVWLIDAAHKAVGQGERDRVLTETL